MRGEQITIKGIIRGVVERQKMMTHIIENQKKDVMEKHTPKIIEITKLRKIGKRAKEKGLRSSRILIQMMFMEDLLQITRVLHRRTNRLTLMKLLHLPIEIKEKARGVKTTIGL